MHQLKKTGISKLTLLNTTSYVLTATYLQNLILDRFTLSGTTKNTSTCLQELSSIERVYTATQHHAYGIFHMIDSLFIQIVNGLIQSPNNTQESS